MSARAGILAGGNWIVDRLKVIDTYPREEALANIVSQSVGNGGSPFNLLVDLAKLGAGFPLAGIGLIGADAEGEWIVDQCRRHGIDARQVRVHPGAPTSYTDVMTVRDTARRTFFHQRGANALLNDGHFDFAASRARHFHLGYLLLLDRLDGPDGDFGTVAARTLARARATGFTTSIDVVSEDSERFVQVVWPALPHVDYCLLNDFELERTTGLRVRGEMGIDVGAVHLAAQRLLEAGVQGWVIIHFPEGAAALGRDGCFHVRGSLRVPPRQIVSTVGAGDAFAAGVLLAVHESAPMETALQYGVCVAAACLQGAGASDGVGALQESLGLEGRFEIRCLTE
jgi:sugar/nucleoside kinase (ribokinase family)